MCKQQYQILNMAKKCKHTKV